MATFDLVFEGGGAKGMVFVGALQELIATQGHEPGRLLGTSSGAILSTFLAAGYSVPEMQEALDEKIDGVPVFEQFMGKPTDFSDDTVTASVLRTHLEKSDLPLVFGGAEKKIDDFVMDLLLKVPFMHHVFSFVERGGWYSADAFVEWMSRKLDEGTFNGEPRRFSNMTLKQFHDVTKKELSLVASDTTGGRILILNHRTAPDVPVVWAARMSMSIPLLWQEVVWKKEWGAYRADIDKPEEITGSVIVDGGILSNFPIALMLSNQPNTVAMMGPASTKNVMGLLIDERLEVPNLPSRRDKEDDDFSLGGLRTMQRFSRLANTVLSGHDNMAIQAFKKHVVHLPAKGIDTTEFDMPDDRKKALIDAGRKAMVEFLLENEPIHESAAAEIDLSVNEMFQELANDSAGRILGK